MKVIPDDINVFLCNHLELTLKAFKSNNHKTPEARELVKLLRENFNYSKKTWSGDIFRVVRADFIKKNHYEYGKPLV
jgi:hypothetical protein